MNDLPAATCPRYRELILDESVGELSPEAERELTAHVSTCAPCASARAELRKALIHTRSLFVPEPAPAYWDSFVPRLKDRIATSQRGISVADVQKKLAERRAEAAGHRTNHVAAYPVSLVRRRLGNLALAASVLLLLAIGAIVGMRRERPAPVVRQTLPSVPAASVPAARPELVKGVEPLLPLPGADGPMPQDVAEAIVVAEAEADEDLDLFLEDLSPDDEELLDEWLDRELEG